MAPVASAGVGRCFAHAALMDLSLTAPIWVLYLRDERGFSLTEITLLEVPLFLLIVIAEVPSGAFADRFGRKTALLFGSALLTGSMLIYAVAASWELLLLSNLAFGLGHAFRSGADVALLHDALERTGRIAEFPRLSGRFYALRSGATLAGYLLGAAVAARAGFSFAIALGALLHACGFVVAAGIREPARPPAVAHARLSATLAAGLAEAWRTPALRWLFLASGVLGAGAAGPLLLLQQPWLDAHGVPTVELGLRQTPALAAEVLAALAAASLLARLGERGALLCVIAALSLCAALLAAVDAAFAAAAFVGVALARSLHPPLLAQCVNRRIASERRATVLSAQSLVGNVCMALAWPLAGSAADVLGLRAAFLGYAVATLALGGAALLLLRRSERLAALAPARYERWLNRPCSEPSSRRRKSLPRRCTTSSWSPASK
jgi:MFS family permease